jgi:predicted Holliday junction resolvase-like endonuclease
MIELIGVGIVSVILIFMFVALWYIDHRATKRYIELHDPFKKLVEEGRKAPPPPQVNVNMKPVEDAIKALPGKVLHSIQSSVNTKKGALGELIGYIELEAMYDRIVPLGNIVDFMCIKFPSENNEGGVDFVDIKTGKNARLSKEQKMLQELIKSKKIDFIKLNVSTQSSATISK